MAPRNDRDDEEAQEPAAGAAQGSTESREKLHHELSAVASHSRVTAAVKIRLNRGVTLAGNCCRAGGARNWGLWTRFDDGGGGSGASESCGQVGTRSALCFIMPVSPK